MSALVLISILFVGGGVAYSYFYFFGKKKLKPMLVTAHGPVRGDDEIMVRDQMVVVNVVFEGSDAVDNTLLADLVLNYKDLMSGKYKAPAKYTILEQEPLEDEPQASYGPNQEDEGEEEVDYSSQPENLPEPSEDEIPEPSDEDKRFEPVDLRDRNFNY